MDFVGVAPVCQGSQNRRGLSQHKGYLSKALWVVSYGDLIECLLRLGAWKVQPE